MQALLAKIRTALGAEGVESRQVDRLDNVVARQRGIRAASVQDRLSRQQTDAHQEEATPPLYAQSVYCSSGSDPEPEPNG